MSNKTVKAEHSMASPARRDSRMKKVLDDSKEIFEKLDNGELDEQKESEEKPLNVSKMKNIRELLFAGSLSKDIEIDGFTFRLKSLNHGLSREVAKRILLLSNEARLVESNVLHVAASLDRINGLTIRECHSELFNKDNEDISDLDLALEIISNLNNHLTGTLIKGYFELSDDSKELLKPKENSDELKK